MNKDRWSPYLTDNEIDQKQRKPARNDLYSLSKERKNISNQLQLMKVRIKQLEKEEKLAKHKAISASELTDNIIERRKLKNLKSLEKDQQRQQKIQEIENLKLRNQGLKQSIQSSIVAKRAQMVQKNKFKAKLIKDLQIQRKSELISQPTIKPSSLSPNPSTNPHKRSSTISKYRIEEQIDLKGEALNEIHKLEALEKILIDKLKLAYDQQKQAEGKVVFLINNPGILNKENIGITVGPSIV